MPELRRGIMGESMFNDKHLISHLQLVVVLPDDIHEDAEHHIDEQRYEDVQVCPVEVPTIVALGREC